MVQVSIALVVAVILTTTAGCGKDVVRYRWEQALLAADRHVDHDELGDARAEYDALRTTAPTPKYQRYIDYRLAYVTELDGDLAGAIALYEPLWGGGVKDNYAADALFRTAVILYTKLGREAEGIEAFDRIMRALPTETAAKKAFQEILGHFDRANDPRGAVAFIDERYALLKETAIGDNLMFRKAQILRASGDLEAAEAAYRNVLQDHADSGLLDDARWELADLYRGQERYTDALVLLRFITEDRDSSWLVGSYDSQYVDEARFKRALIFLEDLDDYDAALEEFGLFLEEFETNILRDDARWNRVQAHLAKGDAEGAEDECEDLQDVEPESRWVDDCQALVEALRGGAAPEGLRTAAVVD